MFVSGAVALRSQSGCRNEAAQIALLLEHRISSPHPALSLKGYEFTRMIGRVRVVETALSIVLVLITVLGSVLRRWF